MKTRNNTIIIDEIELFYREAGNPNNETILLLHGFPSSSHMYREVIDLLTEDYHLIAPDYPGFGLSEAPSTQDYQYTFDNITCTIERFIEALELSSFYIMMQDYGGPIGLRIASKRPDRIKGLIIQNANAYLEGLGEWAQKIGKFQQENDLVGLTNFKDYLMSPDGIREQYLHEHIEEDKIDPTSYLTDIAFMQRSGIHEKQTALFTNYGTNFPKYVDWQLYFKTHQPKTLIVWGIHDKFFSKEGAEAYTKDLENPQIHLFEGGHFMLEEYPQEVAKLITNFIK